MVIRVVARDQEVDIKAQLKLGVRMLQAQAHMYVLASIFMRTSLMVDGHCACRNNKELHFCHTS